MTRDDLVDTIIEWVTDTFGGLQLDDATVDAFVDLLESKGIAIDD